MFGYIFSAILLVYFCVLWPNFEILPPRSARIKRQRLAGKLGLHDMPSIGELDLTQGQKEDLINCVVFTDGQTFAKICNSKHFYLVESRRSVLSLYC